MIVLSISIIELIYWDQADIADHSDAIIKDIIKFNKGPIVRFSKIPWSYAGRRTLSKTRYGGICSCVWSDMKRQIY